MKSRVTAQLPLPSNERPLCKAGLSGSWAREAGPARRGGGGVLPNGQARYKRRDGDGPMAARFAERRGPGRGGGRWRPF